MELHDYKSAFAAGMAEKAGLAGAIDFRVGDAVAMIGEVRGGLDLVLVDLWKDLYVPCLEAFYPRLNPGAIIVADNVGPGQSSTRAYVEAIRAKPHISSFSLPVGQGIEISRFKTT